MPIPAADIAQYVGILTTAIGGVLGYGRLQAQVANHDQEIEKRVTKDSMEPFKDEVIRRLERIENKQDRLNDKP